MLDFNHRSTLSERVVELIDNALQQKANTQTPRDYLGASRLGVACDRALQFEYLKTPVDADKQFSGRVLRIFAAGHVFETLAISWLRGAGFELQTHDACGEQFGFAVVGGRLCGHIDGVLRSGPAALGFHYPALWECKSLNARSWREVVKKGVVVAKPVYAAQVALYQAYMAQQIPGIAHNPALFFAINKDTAELHVELLPFNGKLAQRSSDRGVRILRACDVHELLPRISRDSAHIECKLCAWQQRCWSLAA